MDLEKKEMIMLAQPMKQLIQNKIAYMCIQNNGTEWLTMMQIIEILISTPQGEKVFKSRCGNTKNVALFKMNFERICNELLAYENRLNKIHKNSWQKLFKSKDFNHYKKLQSMIPLYQPTIVKLFVLLLTNSNLYHDSIPEDYMATAKSTVHGLVYQERRGGFNPKVASNEDEAEE